MTRDIVQSIVKDILRNPFRYEWTYQGLGMLRMYFDKSLRLHIWMPDRAVPSASKMHTHPWDLESYVVFGEISNHRFMPIDCISRKHNPSVQLYTRYRLRCGTGGGLDRGELGPIATDSCLQELPVEQIPSGACYRQNADEIHYTEAIPGTTTLVHRAFHQDTEHAYVYCPAGEEWVSAEPREATVKEITLFTSSALELADNA